MDHKIDNEIIDFNRLMNNKIKILNTEYANFGSIKNILRKIGKTGVLINDFSEVQNDEKIILPGVGNFEKYNERKMKKIYGLDMNIKILEKKNKFFCICVGMQILFLEVKKAKCQGYLFFLKN